MAVKGNRKGNKKPEHYAQKIIWFKILILKV